MMSAVTDAVTTIAERLPAGSSVGRNESGMLLTDPSEVLGREMYQAHTAKIVDEFGSLSPGRISGRMRGGGSDMTGRVTAETNGRQAHLPAGETAVEHRSVMTTNDTVTHFKIGERTEHGVVDADYRGGAMEAQGLENPSAVFAGPRFVWTLGAGELTPSSLFVKRLSNGNYETHVYAGPSNKFGIRTVTPQHPVLTEAELALSFRPNGGSGEFTSANGPLPNLVKEPTGHMKFVMPKAE